MVHQNTQIAPSYYNAAVVESRTADKQTWIRTVAISVSAALSGVGVRYLRGLFRLSREYQVYVKWE